MNREQIIQMARDAWLSDKEAQLITEFDEAYISCTYLQDLEAFAKLVAEHEREACVKIVEDEAMQYAEPVWAFEIVNDIKARGRA